MRFDMDHQWYTSSIMYNTEKPTDTLVWFTRGKEYSSLILIAKKEDLCVDHQSMHLSTAADKLQQIRVVIVLHRFKCIRNLLEIQG
jgi:hypothetical protein